MGIPHKNWHPLPVRTAWLTLMRRYFRCFTSKPKMAVPQIPSRRLLIQPMPTTAEDLDIYEVQLWTKKLELDRKLKDVQNMIRSSISQNMRIRATKYLDMAKELKIQSDAIHVRIAEVRSQPRPTDLGGGTGLNTSASSVPSEQTSVLDQESTVYNPIVHPSPSSQG